MTTEQDNVVPIWTLATQEVDVPQISNETVLTPQRVTELRSVLAALADAPIATLEAHPLPSKVDKSRGISLESASPLAQQLSQLISQTTKSASSNVAVSSGEALYRMVVPAKVAAQVGSGLVSPMSSKAAANGIHSALMGSGGIAAHATFVPVAGKAAAAGAAGGSAATAGVAAAGATALTVAAPLVLMAVAVGVSAHADQKRQAAIERITKLLEQLHEDKLDEERNQLDACRNAIDKATAILLDQGRIGASLGLDTAVHTIDKAMAAANRRLTKWQKELEKFPDGRVELAVVRQAFPGIDEPSGTFAAHLELAELAIALKRRVVVLQAVEHAQLNKGNPFESFVRTLQADQKNVDKLDNDIAHVLRRLSTLEIDRSHGVRDFAFRASEVDKLLQTSYRLRNFGGRVVDAGHASDVAIEIARESDGSIVVFPAIAS